MSLLTIPISIPIELEKIMRDILPYNKDAKTGFHLIKWDDVCIPSKKVRNV